MPAAIQGFNGCAGQGQTLLALFADSNQEITVFVALGDCHDATNGSYVARGTQATPAVAEMAHLTGWNNGSGSG